MTTCLASTTTMTTAMTTDADHQLPAGSKIFCLFVCFGLFVAAMAWRDLSAWYVYIVQVRARVPVARVSVA